MNKYSLNILVLLQLLLVTQIECHSGYRLGCKPEDQLEGPAKFFLYLIDNGEVFYKVNQNTHQQEGDSYRQSLKQELGVEKDVEDINNGQPLYISNKEADEKYTSVFSLLKNQEEKRVQIINNIYVCSLSETDMEKYREQGFQGQVDENFALIEDEEILCIGSCPLAQDNKLQGLIEDESEEDVITNNQVLQNQLSNEPYVPKSNEVSFQDNEIVQSSSQSDESGHKSSKSISQESLPVQSKKSQRNIDEPLDNKLTDVHESLSQSDQDFSFSEPDNEFNEQYKLHQEKLQKKSFEDDPLNNQVSSIQKSSLEDDPLNHQVQNQQKSSLEDDALNHQVQNQQKSSLENDPSLKKNLRIVL